MCLTIKVCISLKTHANKYYSRRFITTLYTNIDTIYLCKKKPTKLRFISIRDKIKYKANLIHEIIYPFKVHINCVYIHAISVHFSLRTHGIYLLYIRESIRKSNLHYMLYLNALCIRFNFNLYY